MRLQGADTRWTSSNIACLVTAVEDLVATLVAPRKGARGGAGARAGADAGVEVTARTAAAGLNTDRRTDLMAVAG